MDSLGLGTNDRDTIHRLQPTQGGTLLTSVFLAPSVEFHTEFSPVLWNDSKTNYETYPIASRAQVIREATKMPKPCLNSWMRFEPLSLVAK